MRLKAPVYEYDINNTLYNIEFIENNLTYMLEINVEGNICVDSKMNPIKMDNKFIFYPKNIFGADYENSKTSISFDPFFNKRLAYFLFKLYITYVYTVETGNQVISFFTAPDMLNNSNMVTVCRTYQGDIVSNLFHNEAVCWIDLLLAADNQRLSYEEMKAIDRYIDYCKEVEEYNTLLKMKEEEKNAK